MPRGHALSAMRRPATLGSRLIILILSALLPVLLFAGAMVAVVARQERAAMLRGLQETTRALSLVVDTELQRTIAALQVLALSESLDGSDLRAFYGMAGAVLKEQPTWADIILAGPAGEHVLNLNLPFGATLPPLTRPDVVAETARSLRPVISDVTVGAVTGRPAIVVAVPVVRAGVAKYVLEAAIQSHQWQTLLSSQIREGRIALLLDRRKVFITRTLDGERLAGKPAAASLVTETLKAREGLVSGPTVEGFQAYGAFHTSEFSGWTVDVFAPAHVVDRPLRASFAVVSGGFVLLLICGVGLALLVARRISTPIVALTRSVQALGRGEPPMPVDSDITEVQEATRATSAAAGLLTERLAREQRARATAEHALQELAASRERIEAARREAEAANRAKDEFLAVLSHELRTPLNVIQSGLHILRARQRSDAEREQVLATLARNTRLQAQLISDLLDVSRIVAGKLGIDHDVVDLALVVQRAVEQFAADAETKRIALEADVDVACKPVLGDAMRLEQVVTNLLSNALKFTPANGTVCVSLTDHGTTAALAVRDTGGGIAPELLPHVFARFRQGDSARTRRHGGLGLGLAIVRHLVELHGGTIEVASAGIGRGATVTVTLPVITDPALAESRRRAEVDVETPRLEGLAVLVVDDDPDSLEAAARILSGYGATVSTAGSVAAAVGAITASPPDVVVSDLAMPDEDGYSLVRRIRAMTGASIPVIALTAHAGADERERALAAGFRLHVAKPVDPQELGHAVAKVAGAGA